MTFTHPNKPEICSWISDHTWNELKIKEKDYIIMLYQRKYTKQRIMRTLYIFDRTAYYKFTKKIRNLLNKDILNFNNA